jgi:uncharacterized protein YodC (DUF2158 family)
MEFNMMAFTKRVSIAIALTLGVALSVPLSIPAFSDSAPSQTAMQERAAPPLRSGDLVRLRSGGPLMTVDGIKGDQVDCYWTDGNGQINAESFPIYVLQKSWSSVISPSPSAPIERPFTFIGEQRDLITNLDEANFNQSLKIVRTHGRQFCALGFDVAQHPAKMDRFLYT